MPVRLILSQVLWDRKGLLGELCSTKTFKSEAFITMTVGIKRFMIQTKGLIEFSGSLKFEPVFSPQTGYYGLYWWV